VDERTLARFMAKVRVLDSGCWEFTSAINEQGYAKFFLNGRPQLAHRVAYRHFTDPIPEGMDVDHLCHNADLSCKGGDTCLHRRCCNPEHLAACEHGQNALRSCNPIASINRAKDRCPNCGGEFTVMRDSKGRPRRKCLPCKNARDMRRWKERFDADPEFRERKRRQSREGARRRSARLRATKEAATPVLLGDGPEGMLF
jgi:hypothetical protein